MGKPAARIGDMTAHGGSIVLGCPTVLIGGMPAARLTDMHVCPMVTPAPVPVPHVGGPIILGSAGVLIGGMPAARMGDMAICVGPPDVIALGCMTVLIGEMMPGAAGAPGPPMVGLTSAAAAQMGAATALSDNTESFTKVEHWVEFEFVDKAGLPVSGVHYKFTDPDGKEDHGILRPNGRVRRDSLNAGQCSVQLFSVSNAKWSKDKAEVGEKVKLVADVEGFASGTIATFQIYRRDVTGPDVQVVSIESKVQGNKVEAEWEYVLLEPGRKEEDKQQRYSSPEYYFDVIIETCKARSKNLLYKDYIEIELKDDKGKPVGGAEYTLLFSDGQIRRGKLDGSGKKREEKIPPGPCRVIFPGVGKVISET